MSVGLKPKLRWVMVYSIINKIKTKIHNPAQIPSWSQRAEQNAGMKADNNKPPHHVGWGCKGRFDEAVCSIWLAGAHSLSPEIHHAFADQFGHQIHYRREAVTGEDFQRQVTQFLLRRGEFVLTLPHKAQALQLADQATKRAEIAGVANTLWCDARGSIWADNTDGVGFVNDLKRLSFPLKGARVLILGAGGAVRGLLQALIDEKPKTLAIANRTVSRIKALAHLFQAMVVKSYPLTEIQGCYDLIIHATSAQYLKQTMALSERILQNKPAVYDLSYAKSQQTAFLAWARQAGCTKYADGLGMLIYQALESYAIWHGIRPDFALAKHKLLHAP